MSSASRQKPAPLQALTGVRFFLAMWVVLFHFARFPAAGFPFPIRNFLSSGFLGVDVFFLLSGFLMAYNYLDSAGQLIGTTRQFWAARFARIYPVYFIGLLLYFPILIPVAIATHPGPAFLPHITGVLVTTPLLMQSWFPDFAQAWNAPSWSLSAEAFFYLLFPLAGPWIARARMPVALGSLCGFLLLFTFSFGWMDSHGGGWFWTADIDDCGLANFFGRNPLIRTPEFLLGVLLCRIWQHAERRRATWLGAAIRFSPLVFVLTTAIIAWRGPMRPEQLQLGFPAAMLLVLVLARGEGILARFLSLPPIHFLGEMSYSVYILHVPVWAWMLGYNDQLKLADNKGLPFLAVYLVILIGISSAVFKIIEKPYQKTFRKALSGPSTEVYSRKPLPA